MLKKMISFVLAVVMMLTMGTNVFAQIPQKPISYNQYSVEDVKELEPYIAVKNGKFVFDAKQAIEDGFDKALVDGQAVYIDALNEKADLNAIAINSDLSIDDLSANTRISTYHWSNCGGGRNTNVENHWWGYSRYACDCETNRMSADFNSCAATAGFIGLLGSYFGWVGALPGGIPSGYWWLLASRLDANNHGEGVFVEITWALVFDITPQ